MSNSRAVVRPRLAAIVLFAIFFVSLSIHSVLQPNNFPESEVLVHDLPKKESPRPSHISGDPATDYGDYAFVPSSLVSHFPAPDPKRKDYHEWNAQSLRELHVCMALQLCGQNQRKIALLAAHWFEEAIVREWRGGEGVWGLSVYKHLKALGYTTLFASSFKEALSLYRLVPSLVSVVIRNKAGECHSDVDCVMSHGKNPSGIPAWKIFDFEYFPSTGGHYHASLMKGRWILSAMPERLRGDENSTIQYIGILVSREDECRRKTPIPLSERDNRVFLLMKQLTYIYDHRHAWNTSFFSLASSTLNLSITGAWLIDQHYQWNPEVDVIMQDMEDRDNGVVNLLSGAGEDPDHTKRFGAERWMEEVRRSKALVGVGNPWWSPSPFYALCAGVPFINPILSYDPNDPWNRTKWYTQHPSLVEYDPPLVYHVHKQNYTGFIEALRTASTTEIPSFIPEYLTEHAMRERIRYLMEHDWKEEATVLLEERIKEGTGYMFDI